MDDVIYHIMEGVSANHRQRVRFVQFARWRHRGRSLPFLTASCCWSEDWHRQVLTWLSRLHTIPKQHGLRTYHYTAHCSGPVYLCVCNKDRPRWPTSLISPKFLSFSMSSPSLFLCHINSRKGENDMWNRKISSSVLCSIIRPIIWAYINGFASKRTLYVLSCSVSNLNF